MGLSRHSQMLPSSRPTLRKTMSVASFVNRVVMMGVALTFSSAELLTPLCYRRVLGTTSGFVASRCELAVDRRRPHDDPHTNQSQH